MRKLYIGDKNISGGLKLDDNFVYVPFPQPFEIEYMAIGGGGGGGIAGSYDAGGGGAGRFVSSSYEVNVGNTFNIAIGNGGSVDTKGSTTQISGSGLFIAMEGGGYGGKSGRDLGRGGNGGSGGGGSMTNVSDTGIGGTAQTIGSSDLPGIGNNGSNGNNFKAGNGGEAQITWLDGITYGYSGIGGNNGSPGTQYTTPGSGGRGGGYLSGLPNNGANSGIAGVVKIRYEGQPKATGGTITQSGGYTYHTFTSNDTLTIISSL